MISPYLHYGRLQASVICQLLLVCSLCLPWPAHSGPTKQPRGPPRSLVCGLSGSLEVAEGLCNGFCPFLPRRRVEAVPRLSVLPFATNVWHAPCRMLGSLPFPAKAKSLSGALAPLSCAKRRDKSEMQTCQLRAVRSTFPSLPSLNTL